MPLRIPGEGAQCAPGKLMIAHGRGKSRREAARFARVFAGMENGYTKILPGRLGRILVYREKKSRKQQPSIQTGVRNSAHSCRAEFRGNAVLASEKKHRNPAPFLPGQGFGRLNAAAGGSGDSPPPFSPGQGFGRLNVEAGVSGPCPPARPLEKGDLGGLAGGDGGAVPDAGLNFADVRAADHQHA